MPHQLGDSPRHTAPSQSQPTHEATHKWTKTNQNVRVKILEYTHTSVGWKITFSSLKSPWTIPMIYTTLNVMQPTRHHVTYAVALDHVVDSSGSTNHRVSPFQAENWPLPHKPLYSFHSKPSPNNAKCRKTYPVINTLCTNSASKRLSSICLPVSDNSH